jgi:hypothetical protein
VEEAVWGLLVFLVLVCAECISVVVVEGICVRGCKALGLCKVGTVDWTVRDECIGRRGSLVMGWGRMGGECEGMVKELMRRGRKSC